MGAYGSPELTPVDKNAEYSSDKNMIYCQYCGTHYSKHLKKCPKCGKKYIKPFYNKWWFWLFAFLTISFLWMFTASLVSVSTGRTQANSNNTTEDISAKGSQVGIATEEEFRDNCTNITEIGYNTLLKHEDDYVGQSVKVYVTVKSVISSSNQTEWKTEDLDGNCIVIKDKRENPTEKIIEGDNMAVYGTFKGVKQFTQMINNSEVYFPVIEAKYIDFNGDITGEILGIQEAVTEEITSVEETSEEETSAESESIAEEKESIGDVSVESTEGKSASEETLTLGEQNALKAAKEYLSIMEYSRKGLYDMLIYSQYAPEEAEFACDNCGADWYEQAAKAAKSYLDIMAYSKDGLIDMLEYSGFTYEEALYGVTSVGY